MGFADISGLAAGEVDGRGAMKRILVAYDGGAPARRALETAAVLAQQIGVPVSVVSVVPERLPFVPPSHLDQIRHDEQLDDARRLLESRGISPELIEPIGDPAASIERLVNVGGFDVVVVGSRRLGALARFVEGSVSQHVATHATATVVVVR